MSRPKQHLGGATITEVLTLVSKTDIAQAYADLVQRSSGSEMEIIRLRCEVFRLKHKLKMLRKKYNALRK